jgi:putative hydrolase of the HAD superfamily
VVHIGDDPVLDVEAAAKVGMKTVWVNYEQQPWPTTLPPPDTVITRFDELPTQLEAFNV